MKALIQRVLSAKVTVNGETVSNIEQGLCILVGISKNDNLVDMEYIVRKILSVRLFNDDSDKRWSKSVVDKGFEVLCVSQFTLYNTWKGNKPDFHNAMAGDESKKFYEQFLELLKKSYKSDKIKDGVFGAYMQVSIENDGPVTFEIESPVRDEKTVAKENSRIPQRVQVKKPCEGDLPSAKWVEGEPKSITARAVAKKGNIAGETATELTHFTSVYQRNPLTYENIFRKQQKLVNLGNETCCVVTARILKRIVNLNSTSFHRRGIIIAVKRTNVDGSPRHPWYPKTT